MIQNLDKLIEKRKSWVQINKENNFHDSIKNLLTELYPDNAHFIYELLQNAEDAQATKVSFNLYKDRLVFEHDGKRLFDLRDIESITSIGSSTKIEKYNNIGKFGVGFKAVFAYTDTPKIYSGEYSFQINEMVVPEIIKNIDKEIDINKTTFIFPFNNPKKSQSKAYQEIENGLRKLDGNCLLFLNNISLISFKVVDGIQGNINRKYLSNQHIEIETNISDQKKSITHWLRYQEEVIIHDEDNKDKKCLIAIAYRLENSNKKTNEKQEWQIVALPEGKVFIYFPAAKEHSGLKFHIHAPFASTVARDSIKYCKANHLLRDAISNLVVESCISMRNLGILNVDSVSVLPNNNDNLQYFYSLIRDTIIHAFQTKKLTPTKNKRFAPAYDLYLGQQKIVKLIDDDFLSFITGQKKPLWAAQPSSDQRSKDFFASLDIKKWDYEQLLNIFEEFIDTCKKEQFETYLENKGNKWLLNFYQVLYKSLEEVDNLEDDDFLSYYFKESDSYIEKIKLYRLVKIKYHDGYKFVTPEMAYFENDNYKNNFAKVNFVIRDTYLNKDNSNNKNALYFLEKIGVKEYNEDEELNLLISNCNNIDEHIEIIKKIISNFKNNKLNESSTKNLKLLAIDSSDEIVTTNYFDLSDIYLTMPYINSGLNEIEAINCKKPLSPIYKSSLSEEEINIFIEFLKDKGILYKLSIIKTSIHRRDYKHRMRGYYARETHYSINIDYVIENLQKYIELNSKVVSKLIWNELIHADKEMAFAQYRPNAQYDIETSDSRLVYILKENKWIPDKSGKFHFPQEMTIDKLPEGFIYDDSNGLLSKIGFGENEKKKIEKEKELNKLKDAEYKEKEKFAKKQGFDSVDEFDKVMHSVREFKKRGGDISLLVNDIDSKNHEFPQDDISNKIRRGERIQEVYINSTDKKYETRARKIRLTNNNIKIEANEQLRNEYTNDDGIMICQICKNEMPFKKRNGEYYFETVEIFKKEIFNKEHPSQYIALCPVCAAKYKEFVKNDENAIQLLKMDILTTDSHEVQIYLGDEETTLRFVEKHLFDLQKILEISNDNKELDD